MLVLLEFYNLRRRFFFTKHIQEIVSLSSRCSSFNEQSSSPPDEDGLQSADKAEDVGVSNNTEVAAPATVEEKCLEEELLEAVS